MQAKQRDRTVVREQHQGESDHEGEMLEVEGIDSATPSWMRWSDTADTGPYGPVCGAHITKAD